GGFRGCAPARRRAGRHARARLHHRRRASRGGCRRGRVGGCRVRGAGKGVPHRRGRRARGGACREASRRHLRGRGCPPPQAAEPRGRRARQGLPRHAHGASRRRAHRPLRRRECLMLYWLLVPLARDSIVFNVFRYITFRAAMATVTAIALSFLLGPWMIRRLRALQYGGGAVPGGTPGRPPATARTPPTPPL